MDTMMRHQGIASNPDSIIYVGRNWWGKIVAGIIATPIRSISKYNDDEILYVDSLAISEDYRQSGVGKTLLKNLTPHIDEKFKKLFWVGYKTAIPFYEKLGFKQIDEKQYPEIVKHFAEQRVDYPEYEAFFMHELNPRVKG